ncbi:TlpA family protein disulfide reductase [candidate division KSB1 bacterium]|nr:TlpA family protein disulfide reductase [candidate division KSB1 bacterium]
MKKVENVKYSTALVFAILVSVGCSKQEPQTEISVNVSTKTSESNTKVTISDESFPEAPDFVLSDLSGKPVQLSEFKGKMVILNFWATWCGPCREEIPDFVDLYKKHMDKGLVIIGISLDQAGGDMVKAFVSRYKMNYPVLLTDNQVDNIYGGVYVIPTTFIISRNGRVVNKIIGNPGIEAFKREIDQWL